MINGTTGIVIAWLSTKWQTMFIGLLAGAISLRYHGKDLTTCGKVLVVLIGAVCAGIFTPLLVEVFSLSESWSHSLAFLIGLTSINILDGLMKITLMFKRNPVGFVKHVVGILTKPSKK